MKKKLSVVLAIFNEEKNIKDCLESIKGIAGEIVIVDGESCDKTREVAERYGAKVFKSKNFPIFHINKQLAVDKASGEWILQLDADERLDSDLRFEIEKEIKKKSNQYNGYYLPRKNWFLGRFLTKGGQYPDYVIRLFRNGKGKFPCKSIHEQIEIDGETGYLKNPLIHIADPDFGRYLIRFNRYTDLEAEALKKSKKNPNFLMTADYLLLKPAWWFLLTYFRHKGFVDGFQGFVFSLMSALRFPIIYLKFLEMKTKI